MLDACFIIGLRDVGKLSLLGKVAQLQNWSLLIPEDAYSECTFKTGERSTEIRRLVSTKVITTCQPPPGILEEFRNRYMSLGKGETAALASAFSCKQSGDPVIVITSDQRPTKIAERLGIQTMTTLDFFIKVYELNLMSREEVIAITPVLKKYMWLSDKAISEFLAAVH
jgi:predicted nucleic acid-binding protein